MNDQNLMRLVEEAFAIERQSAVEAGALGFFARALTIATMPHSKVEGLVFTRKNGNFTLYMTGSPDSGLPYGTIPRLLITWMSSEIVKNKKKILVLGPSLTQFMREIDLVPTGGRWGTIPRLKNQLQRLFSCSISIIYETDNQWTINNRHLVEKSTLWWDPKKPDQLSLWKSEIEIGESFFREILEHPVPVDLRAIRALKKSSMSLDIYVWLTYRMSYLKKSTTIPWEALQVQFGAGYPFTDQGARDFKKNLLIHLKSVKAVYPSARVSIDECGLILSPSRTHVSKCSTM